MYWQLLAAQVTPSENDASRCGEQNANEKYITVAYHTAEKLLKKWVQAFIREWKNKSRN